MSCLAADWLAHSAVVADSMDVASLSGGRDQKEKAMAVKRMVAAFENRTNLFVNFESRLLFDYALYLIDKERSTATVPLPDLSRALVVGEGGGVVPGVNYQ